MNCRSCQTPSTDEQPRLYFATHLDHSSVEFLPGASPGKHRMPLPFHFVRRPDSHSPGLQVATSRQTKHRRLTSSPGSILQPTSITRLSNSFRALLPGSIEYPLPFHFVRRPDSHSSRLTGCHKSSDEAPSTDEQPRLYFATHLDYSSVEFHAGTKSRITPSNAPRKMQLFSPMHLRRLQDCNGYLRDWQMRDRLPHKHEWMHFYQGHSAQIQIP